MAIYRGGFETCPLDGAPLSPITIDPLVGTIIADQYVIDKCVGEGAMGRVYLGHHLRLTKRKIAIKVLLGDLAADPTMRLRFGQEAEAASRLQHPNVVSVLDFGKTDSGLNYLVMDFIEGGSLCDRIEEGPLAEAEAIEVTKQICLGLTHAHEQGLVHRDFKPDNVALVDHDGKCIPKILDFGLAIISTPEESSVRLTSAGMVVGTPAYVSPEQAQGLTVDQRTDLFALGVSLYEMLSGKLPFEGTIINVLYKNATEDPPSIADRAGIKVSPELEAIVARLMARDRERRFANARDVLAALESIRSPSASVVYARLEDQTPLGMHGEAMQPSNAMAAASTLPYSSSGNSGEPGSHGDVARTSVAPRGRSSSPLLIGSLAAAIVAVAAAAFVVATSKDKSGTDATNAVNARATAQVDPNATSPNTATPNALDLDDKLATPKGTLVVDAGTIATNSDVLPETAADAAATEAVEKATLPSPRPRLAKGKSPKVPTATRPKTRVVANDSTKPQPKSVSHATDPEPSHVTTPSVDPKPVTGVSAKPQLPPKPVVPTVFKAATSLASFDSHGSLSDSKVRQSIDPVMTKLASCYESAARASKANATLAIKVKFIISENARVENVSVGKTPLTGLSDCIAKTVKKMRPRGRPDTGPQRVEFTLHYKPKQ